MVAETVPELHRVLPHRGEVQAVQGILRQDRVPLQRLLPSHQQVTTAVAEAADLRITRTIQAEAAPEAEENETVFSDTDDTNRIFTRPDCW